MKVIVSALAWISGILGLVICMPLLLLNAFFASPQGISSGSRVLMRVLERAGGGADGAAVSALVKARLSG